MRSFYYPRMEFIILPLLAGILAAVTLFSCFGLGTVLMPVFALFFPIEVAIAATAVVHLANNLFKIALVGRLAKRDVVLRFGIPAVIAAFAGAALLAFLAPAAPLATYKVGSGAAFNSTSEVKHWDYRPRPPDGRLHACY